MGIRRDAKQTMAQARRMMAETKEPLVELLRRLEGEGVVLSLEIGGKEMPVKVRIKPGGAK